MKASFHYLSLLGALYKIPFDFTLSQNDYPRFLFPINKKLKRFVSSTQVLFMSTRFLYYFCLCKSFKELLFCASAQIIDFSSRKSAALDIAQVNLALCSFAGFLSESECKGTTNINTLQIFKRKNSRKPKDFRDCLQIRLFLIILYIRYARLLATSEDSKQINEEVDEVEIEGQSTQQC